MKNEEGDKKIHGHEGFYTTRRGKEDVRDKDKNVERRWRDESIGDETSISPPW